jgi:ABC-type nitrate/sulfonate/bicarbonate transport system substrate-binding protein
MKISTDIRAVLAGVLSLPVLGLGSLAAGAAELIPFRVGEAAPANTFLAIWMAQAAGFYEAQGSHLEIIHMVGGRRPSARWSTR